MYTGGGKGRDGGFGQSFLGGGDNGYREVSECGEWVGSWRGKCVLWRMEMMRQRGKGGAGVGWGRG